MIKNINKIVTYTFFLKLVIFFGNFILNILLAKFLEKSSYGEYSTIVSYGSVIGLFLLLGLNVENMRLLSSFQRISFKSFFNIQRAFIIFLFFTILLFSILTYLLYIYFNYANIILIFIFSVCFCMQLYMSDLYRGLKNIQKGVFFGGALTNLFIIFLLLCYYYFNQIINLEVVLNITFLSYIINNILAITHIIIKRNVFFLSENKELNLKLNIKHIKRSFGYWIQNLLVYSIPHLMIILISINNNTQNVAIYNIAIKFVMVSSFGIILLNTILAPYISEMFASNDIKKLEKLVRKYTAYAFYLSFSGLSFLFLFGHDLLEILFDESYQDSYIILMIIATGQLINLYIGTGNLILQMSKKIKTLLFANFISYIPLLIFIFLFNKSLTLIEFAFFHALMVILSSLVSAYYVKKIFNISINAKFIFK